VAATHTFQLRDSISKTNNDVNQMRRFFFRQQNKYWFKPCRGRVLQANTCTAMRSSGAPPAKADDRS